MRQLNRWSSIRPPGKGFEQKGQRISAESTHTTAQRLTHCHSWDINDIWSEHHIKYNCCVKTARLHRLTWRTVEWNETQPDCMRQCEWCNLEYNWPKIVRNLIWLYALHTTMVRAGGKATARAKSWCDRQADTVPCCPTFSSSSIYELLPAVSGHVKLWPISLHLLEGWPGKPTTLLCFGSRSHVCQHTTISVYLIVECRPRMRFRFLCTVPVLMHFYKKGGFGSLIFWLLQELPLTATVNKPWDMKEPVYHHFQFYAIAPLHTIGSLMILVSMQAREKRLSVQECKFPK